MDKRSEPVDPPCEEPVASGSFSTQNSSEQALKDSEARYRAVVEDMPGMVCRFLSDGTLTFVNTAYCDYFGKSKDELIGHNFFEFIPEKDREQVSNHFTSLDQERPMTTYEHEVIASDGRIRWQEWTDRVLFNANGERVEYQSVGRDVTERRLAREERDRLERQLQHAQKMEAIGTLAGGIAHDFNNLLSTILGSASLLLDSIDASHPHHESLKTIEEQVQRGARLTRQLLGYARKGRYEIKPMDLNRLVSDVAYTFGRTNKNIAIREDLTPDLLAVEGNEDQIQQILLNLLVNAVDAMPEGGDLLLETWNATPDDVCDIFGEARSGDYVMISITDTGVGMSADVAARVFDPFFTTKEIGHGTGLGLASVYGIVVGHEGYIKVDSIEGRGTTFKICLPATRSSAVGRETNRTRPVKGSGTIMLVDDEPTVLDVGAKLIERLGYVVLKASGGREAVELLADHKDSVDLVLLDLIMPSMDGAETFESLKIVDPDVRVVLSSGYSIDDRARDLLARGCHGFIQKPFGLQQLSTILRNCFDGGSRAPREH